MKRTLSTVIVVVLLVSFFAACQKKEGGQAASSKTRVEFWGHVNESWNTSHRSIISKYNASQSEIEVVPTFFPYDDFEAKIQTSLMSGGAGADLYEIWGGWALDFIAGGALAEVPSEMIGNLINDCYEPVLGALQGGGKYYGIPVEFNNEYGGMLVNKPRFENLGIPYPKTWDEVFDVARRTTIRNGNVFEMRGIDFGANDTITTTFLSMILSKGGEYWVNGKLKFTTPEAVDALTTLVNYIVVDHVSNADSATLSEGVESWEYIGRDEVMMLPRGPWVIAELDAEYGSEIGVDFDFVAFPFWTSNKVFPAETGWSWCVPKSSKVADAAWKYASFFLEPANLVQHNIACAQLPPRKSVAQNPEYLRQMPFMQPVLDVLQYGKFIGPFNTEVLKVNLSSVYISLVTNDGAYPSVEAALAALENQCNSELRL